MELPIDRVLVRERTRTEMRNIASLADSIRETGGPLHPPVVRRDGNDFVLVAGARRIEAMRTLGYDRITVTVCHSLTDELAALRAEGEENTEREPFTPSEAVAHAARIEAVIAAKAKERQGQRTDLKPELRADSAQGRTRAEVAKAVGMSHPKLTEARTVVATASDETLPEPVRVAARQAVEAMDRTGNVHGAKRMVDKAIEANKPELVALGKLIDETLPSDWQLIDAGEKGVTAVRKFLCLDAELLAACSDAALVSDLADLIQSFARWGDRFTQAVPAPQGLRLVGGTKS